MKHSLRLGLCIATVSFAAYATGATSSAPTFDEYREPVIKSTMSVKPKLTADQDREFRTRIAEASTHQANFAGHYVLSSFGCGASCVMAFALDKRSGEIVWLPFTVCCWQNVEPEAEPLSFKKNSRLIVVKGSRNEQGNGVYYYELKKSKFMLIHATEP